MSSILMGRRKKQPTKTDKPHTQHTTPFHKTPTNQTKPTNIQTNATKKPKKE